MTGLSSWILLGLYWFILQAAKSCFCANLMRQNRNYSFNNTQKSRHNV